MLFKYFYLLNNDGTRNSIHLIDRSIAGQERQKVIVHLIDTDKLPTLSSFKELYQEIARTVSGASQNETKCGTITETENEILFGSTIISWSGYVLDISYLQKLGCTLREKMIYQTSF